MNSEFIAHCPHKNLGVRAQPKTHTRLRDQMNDRFNLKGLKSLGVRELSYKLAFLACTITPSNPTVIKIQKISLYFTTLLVWRNRL